MNNRDKVDATQIKREQAKKRLNDAIHQLERLGINEETVKKLDEKYRQTGSCYVKESTRALEEYINAKNESNQFP